MFALFASVMVALPNAHLPEVKPRATAVIVHGVRADAREWRRNESGRRREIIREENGQKVKLRILDHE